MTFEQTRYRRGIVSLGYAIYAAIIVLGNTPGLRGDIGAYATGTQLHSLAYGALAGMFYFGLLARPSERAGYALLTIALMGAGDELVQTYFPYRHASFGDWSVDVIAALTISLILRGAELAQQRRGKQA